MTNEDSVKPRVDPSTSPSAKDRYAIEALIETGDLAAARDAAGALLATIAPAERAMVLVLQARALRIMGDVIPCLSVAADAAEAAQTHGDGDSAVEANLEAGHVLLGADDRGRAVAYFEAAEKLLVGATTRVLEARVQHGFGMAAARLNRHAEAIDFLRRSAALMEILGTGHDWFSARLALLCAYSQELEHTPMPEAERTAGFQSLLPQWNAFATDAAANGKRVFEMIARNNYATAQRLAGDYAGALVSQAQALSRAQAFNRRPSIAILYMETGLTLAALERPAEAIIAFQRAVENFADGSKHGLRETYAGLSAAHEALGDLPKALAALKSAREIDAYLTDQEAHRAIARREGASAMQAVSARWERLAKEDSLTDLPNRRAFEQWIAATMVRVTAAQPLTLLMIDIDHFKAVNDNFGHGVGDLTLKKIAEILRQSSRYADLPTRYGGEEFILALPQTTGAVGVEVAQRVRAAVANQNWGAIHYGLNITVSIGVAASVGGAPEESARAVEALINAADRQLYAAKNRGRNCVSF